MRPLRNPFFQTILANLLAVWMRFCVATIRWTRENEAVAEQVWADRGPVICPFRALTGLDCPGCGMTRAVSHVVRGQVGAAVDYNALMVLAVPVALYLYLTWLASLWGRRLPPLRLGPRATAVVIAAGVGFAVVRNLPFGPGRYLNSDPGRL